MMFRGLFLPFPSSYHKHVGSEAGEQNNLPSCEPSSPCVSCVKGAGSHGTMGEGGGEGEGDEIWGAV